MSLTKPETDMLLMSLVIFLPVAFALALLFIPRGREEWMRWVTLIGTAAALVASLCLMIDYLDVVDFSSTTGRPASWPSGRART